MSLAKKNSSYPPLRLIILALVFALSLGALTVQLKREAIEIDLTQAVNKALAFSGLPLVGVDFEGRDGTLSGVLPDQASLERMVDAAKDVPGVRQINHQLQVVDVQAMDGAAEITASDAEFENGLYIPAKDHPLEKYKLEAVQFVYAQAALVEEAFPILDRLALILKQNKQIQIEISVHTDNQGTALGRTASTQARADGLRYYLIERGVAASQILAMGYGATRPLARNDTEENRAKNRRVELRVLKDG